MPPGCRTDSKIYTAECTAARTERTPQKRRWVPKGNGKQRPLGIAALEDKIVQQPVVTVLNERYEEDFRGFSYGFRPGRGQHMALDAQYVAIKRRRVNWILDLDLKSFFDNISHEKLVQLVEKRIADPRVLRLIQKWFKVGHGGRRLV